MPLNRRQVLAAAVVIHIFAIAAAVVIHIFAIDRSISAAVHGARLIPIFPSRYDDQPTDNLRVRLSHEVRFGAHDVVTDACVVFVGR